MFENRTVPGILRDIRILRGVELKDLTKSIDYDVKFLEEFKGEISEHAVHRIAEELGTRGLYIYLLAEKGDDPLLKKIQAMIVDSIIEESSSITPWTS